MNDTPFTIPAGLTHLPDLSNLTPDERRKALAEELRDIRFNGSPADVRDFQRQYPETADWRTRAVVTVAIPKPPGFANAIVSMVGSWLTSRDALRRTNRADVEALNATFGGERFNPANFLNRDLTEWYRGRIEEQFAKCGYQLPAAVKSLSDVKKAAKAAQAGTLPDATTFGTIGTLAGGKLTIGGKAFAVVEHRGHDYVRFHCDGTEARFRLDRLTDFLNQCGLLTGQLTASTSTPLMRSMEGETVSDPGAIPASPGETVSDPAADTVLTVATGTEHRTLSERITSLVAHTAAKAALHSDTPAYDGTGPDPLAMLPA